jgi:SAM-dependent methyltransferase
MLGWARRAVKPLVPARLRAWRRRRIDARRQERFAEVPVRATFARIYAENVWGGTRGAFYSGPGSDGAPAAGYVAMVCAFVREAGIGSIVDLGCGDFRVGARLAECGAEYTGVDVVAELVARNAAEFGRRDVRFECRDIIADELPAGDLCLIRQVLQHLSNAEIARVLENCRRYAYVIVTEHVPDDADRPVPNVDMPHGPGIRLTLNSGVYLDRPPFDLAIARTLHEVEAPGGGIIRSVLVVNGRQA